MKYPCPECPDYTKEHKCPKAKTCERFCKCIEQDKAAREAIRKARDLERSLNEAKANAIQYSKRDTEKNRRKRINHMRGCRALELRKKGE